MQSASSGTGPRLGLAPLAACALALAVGCGAASGLDAGGVSAQAGGNVGGGGGAASVSVGGANGGNAGGATTANVGGAGAGGSACPKTADEWSLPLGSPDPYSTNIHAAVFDPAGDIVVLALIRGAVDFGCGNVAGSKGHKARLLAKLDPHGNLLWQTTWKANIEAYGDRPRLAVDDLGRIYVEERLAAFLPDSAPTRGYMASFDASGNRRWQLSIPHEAQAGKLAVGHDGSLALAGLVDGPADFGLGPVSAEGGVFTSFVARYDDAGGIVSDYLLQGADGAAVIGGVDGIALLPNGDTLTVAGDSDGSPTVLERRSSAGAIVWTRPAGAEALHTTNTPWMLGVATDSFLSAVEGAVESDSLATGATSWRIEATQPAQTCSYPPCGVTYADMAVRADGTAVLAGWLQGRASLGEEPLTATDIEDALLVAVSAEGVASTLMFGGASAQRFETVALDSMGHAVITGLVAGGTLDLGAAGSIQSDAAAASTPFVARVALP